ncbi:MAG: maleylpyruvate isomerase N-terminal domain-containing protein [Chloroflexi bacterium]|nr:maleylpyruvate isomerase N-terminal domain-containing protein [Chloroflexota bacterium]
MHSDVATVTAELDAHRLRFEALCRSLNARELDLPVPASTWLVRDFIAHLATIDDPVREMFRSLREGSPRTSSSGEDRWDVDRWNEARVQERRALTVEQLLAEAAESRARIRDEMARLDAETLARTLDFGGDSKRPASKVQLLAYLRGWCKHDPMHALDMLRAMPGRLTPELEAWFDDPVIRGYQAAMNRDPQ